MNQTDIHPQPLPQPSKVRPVLFSLLILVSGIIIGAGAVLILTNRNPENMPLPPGPEYMSRRMLDHLMRELNLTPQQREALGPIITKHMEAIDKYRQEARPRIREELESMNAEILHVLDPGQKHIWNERIRRMQEHFSRPHPRGPGDRRPDEQRFDPEGQERRRFRERIPGQMPPPPDGQRRPDRPYPPYPEEPLFPPAQE